MKHKTLWGLVLAMGGLMGALLLAQPFQDPLFHPFRSGDPSAGIYWGTAFPTEANTGAPPPDGALFLERTADAGDQPRLWIYSDSASAWNALMQVTGGGGTDEYHPKFDGGGGIEDSNLFDSAANVFMGAEGYIFTNSSTNTDNHIRIGINSVMWEGTANNFETSVEADDPTVDNVVGLANYNANGSTDTYYPIVSANGVATSVIPQSLRSMWWDTSALMFEGQTADNFEFAIVPQDFQGGDTVVYFNNPPAGTGQPIMELETTITAMDGAGDVMDGFLIDIANAVHTAGTYNAMRIDDITGSAAVENAIQIGTGHDVSILGTATLALATPGAMTFDTTDTGDFVVTAADDVDINSTDDLDLDAGDNLELQYGANGITFMNDTAEVGAVNAVPADSASGNVWEFDPVLGDLDGGDVQVVMMIDHGSGAVTATSANRYTDILFEDITNTANAMDRALDFETGRDQLIHWVSTPDVCSSCTNEAIHLDMRSSTTNLDSGNWFGIYQSMSATPGGTETIYGVVLAHTATTQWNEGADVWFDTSGSVNASIRADKGIDFRLDAGTQAAAPNVLFLNGANAAGTSGSIAEMQATSAALNGATEWVNGFMVDLTSGGSSVTGSEIRGFYSNLAGGANAAVRESGFDSNTFEYSFRGDGLMSYETHTETVTDNGGGTNATLTLTPASSYIEIACQDAQGCDVTMDETLDSNAYWDGTFITILCTQATSTLNFTDSGGVIELSATPYNMGVNDILQLVYSGAAWIETSRSNN